MSYSYEKVIGMMQAENLRQIPQLATQTTRENPWPVNMLTHKMAGAVSTWPHAWIEGEITEINIRHATYGYLTLRDIQEDVSMSIMGYRDFAMKAQQFKQGDRVVIHGKPDLWIKATRLSFVADDIYHVGVGDLKAQIEQLRTKLKGEGLFDIEHKIAIPRFPKCIGLICAVQARAESDVITNVNLRWPAVRFIVDHVLVQGPKCPLEVSAAIQDLDANPDVDVIIVARGGGSFEDLIGFSDERVVRAAAACQTPIISAIGHEADWTLIDLAVDLRASTPTDAAKKVVPDVHEELDLIKSNRAYLTDKLKTLLQNQQQYLLNFTERRSLTHPTSMLEPYEREIQQYTQSMRFNFINTLNESNTSIAKMHASLTALSPQSTLNRGYAIVQTQDGSVVRDTQNIAADDTLTVTLQQGTIQTKVISTNSTK